MAVRKRHKCESADGWYGVCPQCEEERTIEKIDTILNGYSWIKVKKWEDDPSLSWEERFNRLRKHHEKETTFLIDFIRKNIKA